VRRIGGMADAEHSKCFARKGVWVQVPHPAQINRVLTSTFAIITQNPQRNTTRLCHTPA
jgi:hypothetical protein